jgi:hypothetical protein
VIICLEDSVKDSIDGLVLDQRDKAVVDLALAYARLIDGCPEMVVAAGPKLLACLDALLMTPRARAAIVKGVNDDERRELSPLDELREARRRRNV